MRSRTCLVVAACAFVAVSAGTGAAANRMVGVVPSNGTNMLVKAFDIGSETTIRGARFDNNDPATVFPEVLLVWGPVSAISEGTVVASASNVHETSLGVVEVTWTTTISASPGTYYLAICPPAGAGKQGAGVGPAVGANDVAAPNGSYITCGAERSLLPIRADLTMSLLTSGAAGGGPSKAGLPPGEEPSPAALETFLRATRFGDGAVLRFGLKQAGRVRLAVYDVSGRLVRELVRGAFAQGTFEWSWDGRREGGVRVSTGVYFVRLESGGRTLTQKLVMIR